MKSPKEHKETTDVNSVSKYSKQSQVRRWAQRNNRKKHLSKPIDQLTRSKIPRGKSYTMPKEQNGRGDKWVHNEPNRRWTSDVP